MIFKRELIKDFNADTIRKKEFFKQISVVDFDKRTGHCEPLIARFYCSRGSDGAGAIHCVVWAYREEKGQEVIDSVGHGKAYGYGYHKESAAMAVALNNAGLVPSIGISGRGYSAMDEVCHEYAKMIGLKNYRIMDAHS